MNRKIKYKDGEIHQFMVKGSINPCNCGSNVYHIEMKGDVQYGVCNACGKDIYDIIKPYDTNEFQDKE